MPRLLKDLRIDDVSSVDRGAGRGVRVVLTKRDAGASLYNKPLTFGVQLPAEVEGYLKREFSQAERDSAASSGAALPDGSFPIKSKADLKNAIQAIGRAKDPAKAKAHIKSRAKDLGAADMIPDTWKRDTSGDNIIDLPAFLGKAALDFDEANEIIEVGEEAGALMREVRDALCALDCSISSIMCDEDVADKGAAIAESFAQFKTHLAELEAGELEKTMSTSNTAPSAAVQKMIDDAVVAAVGKVKTDFTAELAKKDEEIAIAKMSEKHKAFHAGLGSEEEKKKFSAMTPEQRDAHMDKMKKGAMDDPVVKAALLENDELKKRISALEDQQTLAVCKADAAAMGMTNADAGEVLMKARRGDKEAMAKVEAHNKTLLKQRDEAIKTSKLFSEFGTVHGDSGGDALAELNAKAAELRKSAAGANLSEAQAFEKVLLDPANRELAARERQERVTKISGRAA
jgi:hypothetical protein